MGRRNGAGLRIVIGAALAVTPTAAVQAAKKVHYAARFKAKYPEVQRAGEIAVVAFQGPDGDNFAATLRSSLQSATFDGTPVFSLKTPEAAMRPARPATRSVASAAQRFGQSVKASVVFTGRVVSAQVSSSAFTKQGQVCTQSAGLFKCKSYETRTYQCVAQTGQYSVAPQAIRVDTGSIIFTEAVTLQYNASACENELGGGGVQPNEAVLASLRSSAAERIRNMVADYNADVTIALKERVPGLTKEDDKLLDTAMDFAGAGRMDRACGIIESLNAPRNAANPHLLYDLGVCQEAMLPDQPAAALTYYAKADQLLTKPDKMISEAYLRIKTMVGQNRALKQ